MGLLSRLKKATKTFNEEDGNDTPLSKDTRQLTPELRKAEEALLAEVMKEVSQGNRREGVWAKALIDSDGDEEKAQPLYITYAIQSIVDDKILVNKERDRKQAALRAENDRKQAVIRDEIYRKQQLIVKRKERVFLIFMLTMLISFIAYHHLTR